jgi:hypothetical protein
MNAKKALLALFTQLPKGQECGDCLLPSPAGIPILVGTHRESPLVLYHRIAALISDYFGWLAKSYHIINFWLTSGVPPNHPSHIMSMIHDLV